MTSSAVGVAIEHRIEPIIRSLSPDIRSNIMGKESMRENSFFTCAIMILQHTVFENIHRARIIYVPIL